MYLTLVLIIQMIHFTASSRIPHLLIIYENGRIVDFSSNDTLSPSKIIDLKLQVDQYIPNIHQTWIFSTWGYYAYADLQNIYIFDGKGTRDITSIDCLTFLDSKIPQTKLPRPTLRGIGVRVGNEFLISGGVDLHKVSDDTPWNNKYQYSELLWTKKTESWSTTRKKYIYSLKFKPALIEMSCLTSFNRLSYPFLAFQKSAASWPKIFFVFIVF